MSNETIEQPTVAFVRYWRKATPVNAPDDYDKHEASVSVPVPIPEQGIDSQEFSDAVTNTLTEATAIVWGTLGIEFSFDSETGRLVEKLQAPRPQASRPQGGGGGGQQQPSGGSNGCPNLPDQDCPSCGGPTYNNTRKPKSNAKGPDFKCKDRDGCGKAMWLNKDGSLGDWK